MKQWLYLAGAIVLEVSATLALRAANDHPAWLGFAVIVAGVLLIELGSHRAPPAHTTSADVRDEPEGAR